MKTSLSFFFELKKLRLPEFGCGESGEDAGVGEFDVGVGEPLSAGAHGVEGGMNA